jgi:hypothetical protein
MLKQDDGRIAKGEVLKAALEGMRVENKEEIIDVRKQELEKNKIASAIGHKPENITLGNGVDLNKLKQLGIIFNKQNHSIGMSSSGIGISVDKNDKLDIRLEKNDGKEFAVLTVTSQINEKNKFKQEYAFVNGKVLYGLPDGFQDSQGRIDLKDMGFRFGTLNGKSAILGVNPDGNPVALTIDKGDQVRMQPSKDGKVAITVTSNINGLKTNQYFSAYKDSSGKFVIEHTATDKKLG